ncbi:Hsp70 family protein [Desulfobacula toluolica]|uniref:Molecular chaperone, Hsp70 family n=1 Tax=Desulfobacula toluolica (strain DSM 7467 / Tol2) TaxID=651182 RepID=K0NNI1_DESTT|nr:Hsp70 family protein [Desulfobacula toluolica]CCK82220.1 molecular chaperone, Hsp70 family [Desulfobacula toluolica Tol2]
MSAIFGIDFGTSNSALSVHMDGQVRLLDVDRENPISNSLKSILYFFKEEGLTESYVGYEGVKKYIENEADGRYMQSIKTFLPDTGFEKTSIYGKRYTLEELICIFFKVMKQRGQELINQEVSDLVLGRPVIFSEDKVRDKVAQERLVTAAELAGFKNICFQLEPIAAALAYENSLEAGKEQIVLVGDFGAGSSDFTIHKAGKKSGTRIQREQDILSVGGVYIGGDVFDSQIMREKVADYYGKNVQVKSIWSDNFFGLSPVVIRKLMQWHLIPQLRLPKTLDNIKELKVSAKFADKKLLGNLENLIHANYGYLLFQSIEKAKCELSDKEGSRVYFNDYDICIDELLSRDEFESMISEKVSAVNACIDSTLKEANLSSSDIDVVFLTGGSSYIPMIRELFEKKVGKDKIRSADAFTSVAYGLGLHGGLMG